MLYIQYPSTEGSHGSYFRGPSKFYIVKWTWDGNYIIAQALDARSGWHLSLSEIWRIPGRGELP